jgi:hypothetical protein
MHEIAVPDQHVAATGEKSRLCQIAFPGLALDGLEVLLDLVGYQITAGTQALRVVHALVHPVVQELGQFVVALDKVFEFAGALLEILQRDPGRGELQRQSIGT